MICTFGDTTDVTWWRELDLPTRAVIGKDGRFAVEPPPWLDRRRGPGALRPHHRQGRRGARNAMVELLRGTGELRGEPEPITHPVKFYEKGDRPLEIVTSRQWYIRNGGRDDDLRRALLERGAGVAWHPEYMRHRYDNSVEGLNGDWLVSRQRYWGSRSPSGTGSTPRAVPTTTIRSSRQRTSLPIDPSSHVPPGFTDDQRGKPNGFIGDPDIMDTWATSSLTPMIACGWEEDPTSSAATFPMDLRPQAHEIIRTWLFATTVRSHFEHGGSHGTTPASRGGSSIPTARRCRSRWATSSPRWTSSEELGSDGVRYWAAPAGRAPTPRSTRVR